MLYDRLQRVLKIMIHESGNLSDCTLEILVEDAQHGLDMFPSDDADITLDWCH